MKPTPDRNAPPSRLETEFGLTREEALEMKRAIQYLEVSGPQRWERGEKIAWTPPRTPNG